VDNLTVVVPFYNGHPFIHALLKTIPSGLPVIVIDDQSDIPLTLSGYPNVRLERPAEKLYFTGAVNYAATLCRTDILVLNQDVELHGDVWWKLIEQHRREYALIGERIKGIHPAFPHGYIHGVFQFMRRDALTQVGPMDAATYPLWGASALWQWQICRQGFKSLPLAEIPGLVHKRTGGFGDSIQDLLRRNGVDRTWLIRTPPEVSVVIPCYNHGRYIRDAVNSLIGGLTPLGVFPPQTFPSFEVIVVDDGSTDGTTPAAVDAVADGWQGVRVFHTPNGGTAAAHNYGIEHAVGKYITTMSADDMREPWGLEKLYRASLAHPHALVYDNLLTFTNGGRGHVWKTNPYDFEELLYKNMVPVGTMFSKQAWQAVGGYPRDLKYGREDWGFAIAMGAQGYCGVKIDETGYLYRREGQNRTLSNTTPEWHDRFLAQMVHLFPYLYRGERPMACCGGGGSRAKVAQSANSRGAAMAMQMMAGTEGMALVEYLGGNYGSQQWGGPYLPSHRIYVFGNNAKDKIKLIDKRDLAWFLGRRENGRVIFRQVSLPAPVILPESVAETEQVTPQVQGNEVVTVQETVGVPVFDPGTMTIEEVMSRLADQPASVVQAVLDLEQAGRGRKTLVARLKDQLGYVDAE
jgi:glycosyltransferase involved in cell wall biosynthesis